MKIAAVLLASAALTLIAPGGVNAQTAAARADTVDPSLPTQLPRTAIPHHYAITVTPHAQRLTFDGKVGIDLDVIKATRELVLNAVDLKITTATIADRGWRNTLTARVSIDGDAQTATFIFPSLDHPGRLPPRP